MPVHSKMASVVWPGTALDGEDRVAEVRPGAGDALEQPAVAGDDPGVVAVVVEGVTVAPAPMTRISSFSPGCMRGMAL